MKLKKASASAALLFTALFMVLECTCSMAYASQLPQKPAAEKALSCHFTQESKDAASDREDCCGKCQVERAAEISGDSFSKLSGSLQKTFKSSAVLSVKTKVSSGPAGEALLLFDTGGFMLQSPHHSPAIPRAPPVI